MPDPYRPELYMKPDEFSAAVLEGWGMQCPKCKRSDNIYIAATVMIRLYPGGHEAHLCADTDWKPASPCHCGNCSFEGSADDFKIDRDRPDGRLARSHQE
jgi:hypothetical protein